MNTLQQLAHEATDLARPDSKQGNVFISGWNAGTWTIDVHVHNEFAFPHCDCMVDDFGIIAETGHNLDVVIGRMIARVQDAVADTPAEQVPA